MRAARRRAPDPPGDVTPADEEVLRRGGARQVADAVRALPVRQRDCVVLRSYAGEGAPAGRRPEVVALAREDGVLLTVDLATGEQRALRSEGNPADSPGNGAPGYINWVDLSPDGRWVYFSRCCEPGSGETYRIPVEGGTVESIDDGSYPRVSPDGRWVAVSDISLLRVVPADGGGDPVTVDTGVFPTDMVWSPDGTELAAILRGPEAGEHRLAIYRFDGSILTPAESRMSDTSTRFVMFETTPGWGWVGISGVWDDDRSVSQDVSYEWALAVDQDGVVVEQHGFTEGVITPVPGLPAALAADW